MEPRRRAEVEGDPAGGRGSISSVPGGRGILRWAIAGALATAVLLLTGCGDDEQGEPEGRPGPEPLAELPPIENDDGPRRYRRIVADSFELLGFYWNNQLPDLGADPGPPKRLVSYWNGNQDPRCGGRRSGPGNAQYCSLNETISWDGRWVLGELYDYAGDAAVAFLLAHEYGHLVQDRLGIDRKYRLTIEAELNADCLAGAWLGTVDRKFVRFRRADFASLDAGVFAVADPRGVPWWNPSAHGTARERRDALILGAENGPRTCLRELGPGFSV